MGCSYTDGPKETSLGRFHAYRRPERLSIVASIQIADVAGRGELPALALLFHTILGTFLSAKEGMQCSSLKRSEYRAARRCGV